MTEVPHDIDHRIQVGWEWYEGISMRGNDTDILVWHMSIRRTLHEVCKDDGYYGFQIE